MKKSLVAALVAALASVALAAGAGTSKNFDARSPLRYDVVPYAVSGTASVTAYPLGTCPPGGAILRDIIVSQTTAGVAGHHWVATPKKNGTALVTTSPGFTLAAGAAKTTNVLVRPVLLTNPTGGTRPVLDAAQVTCAEGDVFTTDVTLTGVYATGTATLTAGLATGQKVTLSAHDFVAKNKYASNIVTCAAVNAGDTVTVNGKAFAAVAGVAGADQFSIDGTDAQDAAALAAAVTASTDPLVTGIFTAANVGGQATVTFTASTAGNAGNNITIATSNGTRLAITTAGGKLAGAYNPASDEWPIESTLALSATALANAINACAAVGTSDTVTCAAADVVATCTSKTGGTAGNAITWTKTGANITVSGAGTFTGGTNYSTGPTGAVVLLWEPLW
jgi:hypothetical protein